MIACARRRAAAVGMVVLITLCLPAARPGYVLSAGEIESVEQFTLKLKRQRDQIETLYVEYDLETEAHVDPELLPAWHLIEIHPWKLTQHVAFQGDKRYSRQIKPLLRFITPLHRLTVNPQAPLPLQEQRRRQIQQAQEYRRQLEQAGQLAPGETIPAADSTAAFDGTYVWKHSRERKSQFIGPAKAVYLPTMYLAGIGLRPPDPLAADRRKYEIRDWLPDGLESFERCRIVEPGEVVDGSRCVVVEATGSIGTGEKGIETAARFWFDREHGWALRRREVSYNGVLSDRWTNRMLQEVTPGVWLPRESRWTRCAPLWSDRAGQPAYSYVMKVSACGVNQPGDARVFEFKPQPGAKVRDERDINR